MDGFRKAYVNRYRFVGDYCFVLQVDGELNVSRFTMKHNGMGYAPI